MDKELWDVVDSYGMPLGETYERGTADWPTGRYHLIVAVCVHRDDGAILITQRAAEKEFALGWEFPGGSALAGESSQEAAARELREETGLAVSPGELILIERFVETSALLDFYVAKAPARSTLSLQVSEVAAAQWVSTKEVERRLEQGLMAEPWIARLATLWPLTLETLGAD